MHKDFCKVSIREIVLKKLCFCLMRLYAHANFPHSHTAQVKNQQHAPKVQVCTVGDSRLCLIYAADRIHNPIRQSARNSFHAA
jgi:hypothetical protein